MLYKLDVKQNMKKQPLIITFLLVFHFSNQILCQQSVARQCVTQVVNLNGGNLNPDDFGGQPNDPGDANTIQIFRSICRNIDNYVQCFGRGLNASQQIGDFFLGLLYNPPSMRGTYRGFCNDMQEIEPRIQCLHITPPIQRCYDDFNQAVNQIGLSRNQAPVNILKSLACNVSVSRYNCEINVYRQCNARIGQIMSDFLFGGLPVRCQIQTGVRSLYTQLYGGAQSLSIMKSTVFLFVLSFIQLSNIIN